MTSKQAKELYEVAESSYLRDIFIKHPHYKKKFLNYLKSQEYVTSKIEYYLRNLLKNTSLTEDELNFADFCKVLGTKNETDIS